MTDIGGNEFCAHCGNYFKHGQICDDCKRGTLWNTLMVRLAREACRFLLRCRPTPEQVARLDQAMAQADEFLKRR